MASVCSMGNFNPSGLCALVLVAASLVWAPPLAGQIRQQRQIQEPEKPAYPGISSQPFPDASGEGTSYSIGPGDVLSITFANSPELNQKVQVTQGGDVSVPLVSTPIHAAGLTPIQLSREMAKSLQDAGQLRDPSVSVFVEEHNSHFATVLGAVAKPGVYPLVRPTRLLELLSMAGGLITSAGATLTVMHVGQDPTNRAEASSLVDRPPLVIQLATLTDEKSPSLNVMMRSGDVVNVSQAPLVYVVGAVTKPGGFVLQNPQAGVTVLQAIALAEGLRGTASAGRSIVIRRPSFGKERELISIDIGKLMSGKEADRDLQQNDILFVPESGIKKTMQALAHTAEASAAGIATYGIGLRVSH